MNHDIESKARERSALLHIELLFEKLVDRMGSLACSIAQIHDSLRRIEYALTRETSLEDEPTNRESPQPFPLIDKETGQELHPKHYHYQPDRYGDVRTDGGSTYSGGGYTDDTRRTK